jgi:N-acetylglucosaminyl-diphospho-decaprenol L-rhamnosyltransferase
MRLLVVIVNYRTGGLVVDCLRSLAPEMAAVPGSRVVVTDNASGDGSIDRIADAIRAQGWSAWASTMPLATNGGFAAGNNAAIQPALQSDDPPDFVLLLNPDTVVRAGAVTKLLEFMDAWPAVGIAGSRLEDPDGRAQRSAFRFPSVRSELENGLRLRVVSKLLASKVVASPVPEGRCEVDWVAGASLIVRRAVFDAIGLLDEGYFMYFEEVDFCLRARRAGWPCWYVPASRVVHLVGQSSGVTDVKQAVRKRRPAYWFASRRRYFRKHHGWFRAKLADLAWAGGYGLFAARRALTLRRSSDPRRLGWDFVKYNFLLTPRSPNDVPAPPAAEAADAPAIPTSKRRPRPAAGGGGIDANSALWAAMQRDAIRDRRTRPDGLSAARDLNAKVDR